MNSCKKAAELLTNWSAEKENRKRTSSTMRLSGTVTSYWSVYAIIAKTSLDSRRPCPCVFFLVDSQESVMDLRAERLSTLLSVCWEFGVTEAVFRYYRILWLLPTKDRWEATNTEYWTPRLEIEICVTAVQSCDRIRLTENGASFFLHWNG